MIFHLIKKDLLLIRHHIVFLLLVTIGIPLFFVSRGDSRINSFIFLLMIIFVELSIYQDVSIEEEKYPNATMLLCSLPISRKQLVLARYLLSFFIFLICTILCMLTCWLSGMEMLVTISSVSDAWLSVLTILGICIPLQYWYGYGVSKYVFSILCVSSPFAISALSNNKFMPDGSSPQSDIIKIIMGILIYSFSYRVSCRIFSNIEF